MRREHRRGKEAARRFLSLLVAVVVALSGIPAEALAVRAAEIEVPLEEQAGTLTEELAVQPEEEETGAQSEALKEEGTEAQNEALTEEETEAQSETIKEEETEAQAEAQLEEELEAAVGEIGNGSSEELTVRVLEEEAQAEVGAVKRTARAVRGVTAYGSQERTEDSVASVTVEGEVPAYYDTIADAWNAAAGKTADIRLLQSQTVTSTLKLDNAASQITLEMEEGVSLNGSFVGTSSTGYGILQISAGSLTMNSGTVENTYSAASGGPVYGIYVAGTGEGGSFTMNGGTVKSATYTGICVTEAGKAEITGGVVNGPTYGILVNLSGSVSVSGGAQVAATLATGGDSGVTCGICVYGSDSSAEVSGGTVSGGDVGVFAQNSATLSGGTVSGSRVGIFAGSGAAVKVSQGTVESAYCPMNIAATAQAEVMGGDFRVTSENGAYGIYVVGGLLMSGGNVSGGYYGLAISGTNFSDGTVGTTGKVRIDGGTFSGTGAAVYNHLTNGTVQALLGKCGAYYSGEKADEGQLITEGLDGIALTGTVTVAQNHTLQAATDNGDGTHTGACSVCGEEITEAHVFEANGYICIVEGCHAEEKVASVESTDGVITYFAKLKDAWDAAQGKTAALTLLKSQTVEGIDTGLKGSAGQVIMQTDLLMSDENTNLTLRMDEGVSLTGEVCGGIINITAGTLTMESGEIRNSYSYSGNINGTYYGVGVDVSVVESSMKATLGKGSFYLKDGTVAADGPSNASGIRAYTTGEITVSSGTAQGTMCGVQIQAGTLEVTGDAVVEGTDSASSSWGIHAKNAESKVTISGGTVQGNGTGLNGIYAYGANVQVEAGEITGIRLTSGAYAQMTGGEITRHVYVWGSAADISGGYIHSTRATYGVAVESDGTVNLSGDVKIDVLGTQDSQGLWVKSGCTATVSGDVDIKAVKAVCVESGGTVEISGGMFTGDKGNYNQKDAVYYGMHVKAGGKAELSGGIFTGMTSAIMCGDTNSGSTDTVRSLLADGFAYYKGSEVSVETAVTEDLDGSSLGSGLEESVTVAPCLHPATGTVTDNGDGTHTGTCVICGNGADAPHSCENWTADADGTGHTGTCTACGAEVTEAHSYAMADKGDGTHTSTCEACGYAKTEKHTYGADGICTACQAEAGASVTVGEATAYYHTLKEAWEEAQGKTAAVRLLKAADLGGEALAQTGADSSITLEMAEGAELSGSSQEGVICINQGSFTLQGGTVKGSTIGISVQAGAVAVASGAVSGRETGISVAGGKVTVMEGTVSSEKTGISVGSGEAVIAGGAVSGSEAGISVADGKVTVTEGNVSSGKTGISVGSGEVSIEGGTVSGSSTGVSVETGAVTVTAGNVSSENTGISVGSGEAVIAGGAVSGSETGISVADGKVTVTEGNVSSEKTGISVGSGEVSIEGGTVRGSSTGVSVETGAVTVTAGNVSSENTGISAGSGEAVVSGGTVSGNETGISVADGKVTVTAGNVSSEKTGISAGSGEAVVSGGAVSGSETGISVSGGKVTVTEGNVSSGNTGISVESGEAVIEGGTVSGNTTAVSVEGGKASISGGTFLAEGDGTSTALRVSEGGEAALTGGVFCGGGKSIFAAGSTAGSLLAEGHAYRTVTRGQDGTVAYGEWVTDAEAEELAVDVEVREIPVRITAQPSDPEALSYGYTEAPQLSVSASGSSGITYQWYEAGESGDTAVSGADGAAFTFPLGKAVGAYQYYCTVSCDGYTLTSGRATVTVGKAQPVCSAPQGLTAEYGSILDEITLENPAGNTAGTWKWKDGTTVLASVGTQEHTAVFTPEDTGNYQSMEVSVPVLVVDTMAPTGEITLGTNRWAEFLNTVTFGYFFKETQTVTITGGDNTGTAVTIEYLLSAENMDEDAVKALGSEAWTAYSGAFGLEPNSKQMVYARITDASGNQTAIRSDGIVVYSDSAADTESITYIRTSLEDQEASVRLNGNTIKGISNGDEALAAGTDYETGGNGVITLKAPYLERLETGDYTLEVSYLPMGEEYVEKDGNEAPETTQIKLHVVRAQGAVTDIRDLGKTYDGGAVAAPTYSSLSSGTAKVEYKAQGADDASYTAEAPKDAGDYTVRVTVAADGYYGEASQTADFTISRKPVIIKGTQAAAEKRYDGTAEAVIKAGGAVMAAESEEPGICTGDDVEISAGSAAYEDKNVGTGKTVAFSGFALSGADAGNYELKAQPESVTADITALELTVKVSVKDKQHNGRTDAEIESATLRGVLEGDDVTLINGVPEFESPDVGSDIPVTWSTEFSLSGTDAGNYELLQPEGVTASITEYLAEKGVDYTVNSNDWINGDFTVTAQEGRLLSGTNDPDGEWKETLSAGEETAEGSMTFYVKNTETGVISEAATETYKIDKTAPETYDITFNENSVKQFIHTVTFGLLFDENVDVRITAEDALSGVASVEYYRNAEALSQEAVENITGWTEGSSFSITAEDRESFVLYVKATDRAGNITCFASDGASFDLAAPVIGAVQGGQEGWYTGSRELTFTVTDQNPDKVFLRSGDGSETELAGTDGTYRFTAEAEGETVYTIRAVDLLGHESTATVTVKIDRTQPKIQASGNTSGAILSDTVRLEASAGTSGIAKVEVSKDGGAYTDITAAYASGYTVTENGTYTFRLTSGAGVTAEASITYANIEKDAAAADDKKQVIEGLGVTEKTAAKIMEMAEEYKVSVGTILTTPETIQALNLSEAEASEFYILRARSVKQTKTQVKVQWKKVKGADGYLVYGKKCSKTDKYRLLGDVPAGKTSFTQKKLKKATKYRYIVVAYKVIDGKQVSMAVSKTIHATTSGGKYGVATSLRMNASKVSLRTGKRFRLKATEINRTKKIHVHRTVRYESTNPAVAVVNAKTGVIRAKKKGTCTIFTYTQNGLFKKIKVTVK